MHTIRMVRVLSTEQPHPAKLSRWRSGPKTSINERGEKGVFENRRSGRRDYRKRR